MKIFHYEPQSGILLGSGVADESPLEPGVYLIPGCATTAKPPALKAGQRAVFSGEAWTVEPIPPEPEPETEPPVLAALVELTLMERLNYLGISLPELKAALEALK